MKSHQFKFAIILFLVIVTFLWYTSSFFGNTPQSLIRPIYKIMAIWGTIFIYIQYVLSTRLRWLERNFGLDRMLHQHRYFGRAGVVAITIHGILVLYSQWLRLGRFNFSTFILIGIVALMGYYITAGLASTYKKINLRYETWKNIHLINYILFPISLFHVWNYSTKGSFFYYLWIFFAATYLMIIAYRVHRIHTINTHPYTIVAVAQEAVDTWSLYFKGSAIKHKPGQFMLISLLRQGKRSASHPFTISSSPDSDSISITPKELGDFTSTIKHTKLGDRAFIDAPYGIFSYLNLPQTNLVMLAGGIGITPFMSMLRYMKSYPYPYQITLLWGNKKEAQIAFKEELNQLAVALPSFKWIPVMSHQSDWNGETGYLSFELIQKYHQLNDDTHFLLCGPPPMTQAVLKFLSNAGISRNRVHFEVFEL